MKGLWSLSLLYLLSSVLWSLSLLGPPVFSVVVTLAPLPPVFSVVVTLIVWSSCLQCCGHYCSSTSCLQYCGHSCFSVLLSSVLWSLSLAGPPVFSLVVTLTPRPCLINTTGLNPTLLSA
ncbi:UNVERIFIED_CONTAM: hypothetical protein FKN15_055459 [Acipenser sinensis]